ncbi:helix-turn-helix domain-containing protein [Klebsiella pneumoniae]|uniref:helix-turn-helix domain-containing protein n=1 Tax=Klebsiella pneumoniae TaxID=573 RepID=UPI002E2BD165|nr:helix-turn-helix domain-containing protein [Klebsiella pneumoniae]MED6004897.1 helix-turn-helix domain-containing protein [Klebsiella pneumoniae]MED6058289.1 helix-turn-helix domain-containing protein [Klebsiella pneumoniae]
MKWDKIIPEVLEHKGITQLELAEKTGVSACHLSLLRHGKRKDLNFDAGLKIVLLHPNKKELLKG